MEKFFIKAVKKNKDFDLNKLICLKKQNKKIILFYTSQYSLLCKEIFDFFKGNVIDTKPRQILGCSKINLTEKQKKEYILLVISDGRFHSLPLAIANNKEVFVFNGYELNKISNQDIKKASQLKKLKQIKFFSSEDVGLISSIKKYQCHFDEMHKFFEKLKKENKKNPYIFLFETLNLQELENFCLDICVNFSCPGIEKDNKKIINFESLEDFD